MTQEDLNDLTNKNMPQWRKDQIHNEKSDQEIYESGQRSRDKEVSELEKQIEDMKCCHYKSVEQVKEFITMSVLHHDSVANYELNRALAVFVENWGLK